MKKVLISTLIIASIYQVSFADSKNNEYLQKNFDVIYINEEKNRKLDVITHHNTNFINAGVLSRELGLNVTWQSPTVTINDNEGNTVKINVGDVNIRKNDKTYLMYDAPFIKNDRIYVPLRSVCEIFGYNVEYYNNLNYERAIKINTTKTQTTVSSDNLEYDLSKDKRFGISSVQGVYIVPEESSEGHRYSKVFLKDFKTNTYYKLGHTIGSERHIFTNDNKLILRKLSDVDINSHYYKQELIIINLNDIKTLDKISYKEMKFSENNNTLYFTNDYKKYVSYNLTNLSKKEITKSEYEKIDAIKW